MQCWKINDKIMNNWFFKAMTNSEKTTEPGGTLVVEMKRRHKYRPNRT